MLRPVAQFVWRAVIHYVRICNKYYWKGLSGCVCGGSCCIGCKARWFYSLEALININLRIVFSSCKIWTPLFLRNQFFCANDAVLWGVCVPTFPRHSQPTSSNISKVQQEWIFIRSGFVSMQALRLVGNHSPSDTESYPRQRASSDNICCKSSSLRGDTTQWNVVVITLKMGTESTPKRRRIFTSWRGRLPKKIPLDIFSVNNFMLLSASLFLGACFNYIYYL